MPAKSNLLPVIAAFLGAAMLAVAIGIAVAAESTDNNSGLEGILDFRVPLETYPSNPPRIKTMLEGANAEPRSGGLLWLTDAKLTTFDTNGAVEMLATTPGCTFNSVDRTISSPNPLKVQTADNKFLLEGRGFMMTTNSHLLISNAVHSVIHNSPTKAAAKL